MEEQYFVESEARALVGRRVRTRVAFSGVPAGTVATDWFTRAEFTRWIEELSE